MASNPMQTGLKPDTDGRLAKCDMTGDIHPDVKLESKPCPMGCEPSDDIVVEGFDRLHGIAGRYRVVKCRHCGLMRTDPRPTIDTIDVYYPSDYMPYRTTEYRATAAPAATAGFLHRLLVRDAKRLPPLQPGNLLELGCASGNYLREMADRGWSVQGIEFSPQAAERAKALGLSVHTGTVEDFPGKDADYRLVAGWMVLEHLHDPVGSLRKIRQWSAPDGRLVMSLPDAGSLEFRVFGDAWYALQLPSHLYHYTPATLKKLLAKCGWEVEKVFWHRNARNLLWSLYYKCRDRHMDAVAGYLEQMINGTKLRRLTALLGIFLGLTRQSGRITVWARKSGDD